MVQGWGASAPCIEQRLRLCHGLCSHAPGIPPNLADTSRTSCNAEARTHACHQLLIVCLALGLPTNMSSLKKDDESGINQYYHNKTTVIQDARVFNESPISPRKCRALLAQIVYLLYVGETFQTQEATTLFFGVTKLFQHKDVSLVYNARQ